MRTTVFVTPTLSAEGHAWGARSFSLALHVGIIALAIWSTQRPRPAPVRVIDPSVVMTWPHRDSRAAPRPPTPVPPGSVLRDPIPVPSFPTVVLPPPAGAATVPSDPFPATTAVAPSAVPMGPPSPASPVAPVMDVHAVEEPPVLLSHPQPGYPELLRRAGIEGRVVVEAVVDTAGGVVSGSLRVISSSHALFVPEATALVRGSHYRPARFAGRPVRVRIQVPVTFALRR
jgi:protein TonB